MTNEKIKDPTISELSRNIVSRWISACGINLRVSDGLELQRIITKSIPRDNADAKNDKTLDPNEEAWRQKIFEARIKRKYEAQIELIRIQERATCSEAIAKFKEEFLAQAYKEKIELIRMQEREACIEEIIKLKEEPFMGFISKQQALNACAYHDTKANTLEIQNKPTESDSAPELKLA